MTLAHLEALARRARGGYARGGYTRTHGEPRPNSARVIPIRDLGSQGLIPGLVKSSW